MLNCGKTILSLCDYSGAWCAPYRDAGYNVMQIDIKHGIDMRLMEYPGKVHGILAAPPCTHFCSSGARWWKDKGEQPLIDGLALIDACLRFVAVCEPRWWVLENPVGRLVSFIGPPAMMFDPYEFGDPYTKRTCLWGKFAEPTKTPCEPIEGIVEDGHNNPRKRFPSKMHLLPPTANRAELRSMTPTGFSGAFFKANP